MKNKGLMMVAGLFASALTFFAATTAASACYFACYQPEEPKLLREE